MFSIAFSSLFGQDSVYRRPAHAEGVGNGARRLSISVHPLRQSSFLLVKRRGSSDVLAPCPTRLPCRCSAFTAEFKFKLGKAGEHPATMRPVALDVSMASRSDRTAWRLGYPVSDRTFKRGFWVMSRPTCASCAISPPWHNWHNWAPRRGTTGTTGLKSVAEQCNSCMQD